MPTRKLSAEIVFSGRTTEEISYFAPEGQQPRDPRLATGSYRSRSNRGTRVEGGYYVEYRDEQDGEEGVLRARIPTFRRGKLFYNTDVEGIVSDGQAAIDGFVEDLAEQGVGLSSGSQEGQNYYYGAEDFDGSGEVSVMGGASGTMLGIWGGLRSGKISTRLFDLPLPGGANKIARRLAAANEVAGLLNELLDAEVVSIEPPPIA